MRRNAYYWSVVLSFSLLLLYVNVVQLHTAFTTRCKTYMRGSGCGSRLAPCARLPPPRRAASRSRPLPLSPNLALILPLPFRQNQKRNKYLI